MLESSRGFRTISLHPSCTQNADFLQGPYSSIHPSLPTTCFLDVVVVPLATWIYLVAIPPLLFMLGRPQFPNPMPTHNGAPRKSKRVGPALLLAVYSFLLVAMVAMVSLELARLASATLGIGLLPFVYIGIIAAGILHIVWKDTGSLILNAAFWILLGVANAIKVATEVKEGINERKGSMYPMVDEITDVAVMVGLCTLLFGLELFGLRSRKK